MATGDFPARLRRQFITALAADDDPLEFRMGVGQCAPRMEAAS